MSDELAKAERAWRWRAEHPRGINLSTGQKVQLRMLLAEFDRLRLVEQAAREVVRHFNTDAEMSRNFGLDERISNLEDALSTERT